ncbi:MAG TPA: hypothetical protein VG269_24705 [Tepidisphaeraceae bacterium]|nr:hypothetical protein [Tepidisphaeraceae bacterium]
MSEGWAVRLPLDKAPVAASLRTWPGVLACETDSCLWLRGSHLTDELTLELRKLPGAERYTLLDDDSVTPIGARVPSGKLPDTGWQPLAAWIAPAPQPAALSGKLDRRAAMRLVRVGGEERASVLVTNMTAWAEYARSAPQVRLGPLRFAVAADGRALVRGIPLPSIAGTRYVEAEGIAIPCGFRPSPPIDPSVLRTRLGISPTDLALFHEDGSWERLDSNDFVGATRSSARASGGIDEETVRQVGR